jgi:hypothetical protein
MRELQVVKYDVNIANTCWKTHVTKTTINSRSDILKIKIFGTPKLSKKIFRELTPVGDDVTHIRIQDAVMAAF